MSNRVYSVRSVVDGLKSTLIEYLEAQYHIWDESLIRERRQLLEAVGVTAQLPFLEATPSYEQVSGYEEVNIPRHVKDVLSKCAQVEGVGVYPRPFVHQANALDAVLSNNQQLIVATGTGSGKTESFLLPIAGDLALEANEKIESRDLPGCRALLLYPMNALVNDQLGRLRRLFGNAEVSKIISGDRQLPYRFAMYTSRTPYPGQKDPGRDRRELKPLLESLFTNLSTTDMALLKREGKWPSKDIEAFIASEFRTSPEDRELFTRQEIQARCPEILVTNYSMLEYMLLRPIEAQIFEQTANWLEADDDNVLTVVLDEAHMYRGAQGAEVALLLRRLQSRLRVSRDRIRYILTSASFGSSDSSREAMLEFAQELTGSGGSSFSIVESKIQRHGNAARAKDSEIESLRNFRLDAIQGVMGDEQVVSAAGELNRLAKSLGLRESTDLHSEVDLRQFAQSICEKLPPAALLADRITGQTHPFLEVATDVFGDTSDVSLQCLEALLGLVTFAKKSSDDRPYLPVRLHLFFRGLSGIYACTNADCTKRRSHEANALLGRLYEYPRLRCECGARVYEILTHRDCGAAFIRGYLRDTEGDFLWHEPPAHSEPNAPTLIEGHFLIEADRDRSVGSPHVWLHTATGRISVVQPRENSAYMRIVRAPGLLPNHRPDILSFAGECPVCLREWRGDVSRIMDFETKGEQPFAHLIKSQVQLQPPSRKETRRFPNAGRKSLLFSDGRQKAARLARDIPREIEQDTFRQLLMESVRNLRALNREAVPTGTVLYLGFVDAIASHNLELFDGADAKALADHIEDYRDYCDATLSTALEENLDLTPPPRYKERLLRQLGAPFYSLFALTLGYVAPRRLVFRRLRDRLSQLSNEDIESISVVWIQRFLDRFAFDPSITASTRSSAAGWRQRWGLTSGYRRIQRPVVDRTFGDASGIQEALFAELTVERDGFRFLEPNKLCIVPAFDEEWYQCPVCTFISPVTWRGQCANCGNDRVVPLSFDDSAYLRARKTFWRDPVVRVLQGLQQPFALNVQEHTAQLGHRDTGQSSSTTELFERCFRDILVGESDRSIDVLSCTTTMEVGIDIGSLVAVGLRNVPPQRQNYQQRAGRAGRRGAAVSSVVTYAQNNPHDNHYFENPNAMIAGSPPDPRVDSDNPTIVSRHANAQLLQTFFHAKALLHGSSGAIATVLGSTIDFFFGSGEFTISAFSAWLQSENSGDCLTQLESWLPDAQVERAAHLGEELLAELTRVAPGEEAQLVPPQDQLLEFLFTNGILPSYAFPRHLLALQIERRDGRRVRTEERPQQNLSVALSEYAPGRWVVVNKRTYKIGTVAANSTSAERNRATRLFDEARRFIQCPNCFHTELEREMAAAERCPICANAVLSQIEIIQPEVVYPESAGPIDELGDEQVFTEVTSAQLPYPRGGQSLLFDEISSKSLVAHGHNEELVVVNRGESTAQGGAGFLVCGKCGKTQLPSAELIGRHDRDYLIQDPTTQREPPQCDGEFRSVYLGYTFPTDILVLRVILEYPLNSNYDDALQRRPLIDAVRSLSESLALAAATRLDIDPRELKAGFRFLSIRDERVADIFLYDTLAGGAGYASMAGKSIKDIMGDAERLLRSCDCTSSCDRCLRSYDNRYFHRQLDRFLALQMLRYAKFGEVPAVLPSREQRRQLEPLVSFLELEGWQIEESRSGAFSVRHGETDYELSCYPGLRDSNDVEVDTANGLAFSDYEVSRALPDVAARVLR